MNIIEQIHLVYRTICENSCYLSDTKKYTSSIEYLSFEN